MIGQTLCSCQIVERIGAGGTGGVYRARDTTLNRDVALKVLPEAFARDAERMARFQREAQVLASLNNPNVAAIYGLEESGDVRALVMEVVEGPTLAELVEKNAKLTYRFPGRNFRVTDVHGSLVQPLLRDEILLAPQRSS